MKLLRPFLLHATVLLLAACTQPTDDTPHPDSGLPTDPYAVSIDEAIENLQEVLAVIDGEQTRSQNRRRIREVKTIRNRFTQNDTRASQTPAPENLLHIVNFEDNGGFAIMSADKRMADQVIAVTESGNLNLRILDSLCAAPGDSLWTIGRGFDPDLPDPIYDGIKDWTIRPDLHFQTDPIYIYSDDAMYSYGAWEKKTCIGPMILSKWSQSEPCNYYAVMTSRGPYAGCGPVAFAQFLTYFVCERSVWIPFIEYKAIDWAEIKKTFNNKKKVSQANVNNRNITDEWKAVSFLIYMSGEHLNADYHSDGTGITQDAMSDAMRNLDFIYDFGKVEFTHDIAKLMVFTRRLPVIMRAAKHNHHSTGHMWLLDGWLTQQRTVSKLLQGKMTHYTETRELVHCNWGWGGYGDGYFVPGYFRLTARQAKEEGVDSNDSVKIDNFYTSRPRLFTYQSYK